MSYVTPEVAKERGQFARERGIPMSANPFDPIKQTPRYLAWNRGWEEERPKEFEDTVKFDTGAVRGSGELPRYDLISPIGLRRLAETHREGTAKYGCDNWLKGIPCSNLLNHLLTHIEMWRQGDISEDHLGHAAWNLFAIMHFEETRPELLDSELIHRRNKVPQSETLICDNLEEYMKSLGIPQLKQLVRDLNNKLQEEREDNIVAAEIQQTYP